MAEVVILGASAVVVLQIYTSAVGGAALLCWLGLPPGWLP